VQFGPSPAHDEPTDGCWVGQVLHRQSPSKPHEHWVVPQLHTLPGSLHGDMFPGSTVGHCGGPPVLELLVPGAPPAPLLLLVLVPVAPPTPLLLLVLVPGAPPTPLLVAVTLVPLVLTPLVPLLPVAPIPLVPLLEAVVPVAPVSPPVPPDPESPPDPVDPVVPRTVVPHAIMPTTAIPRHATIFMGCIRSPSKPVPAGSRSATLQAPTVPKPLLPDERWISAVRAWLTVAVPPRRGAFVTVLGPSDGPLR
jgi:hypothetical protein